MTARLRHGLGRHVGQVQSHLGQAGLRVLFERSRLRLEPARTQRLGCVSQRTDSARRPPGSDELLNRLARPERRLVPGAGLQKSALGLLGQVR